MVYAVNATIICGNHIQERRDQGSAAQPLSPSLQPLRVKTEAENQQEEKVTADTNETDRMIMISLEGPIAPFQYRKISTAKRLRFPEKVERSDIIKRKSLSPL